MISWMDSLTDGQHVRVTTALNKIVGRTARQDQTRTALVAILRHIHNGWNPSNAGDLARRDIGPHNDQIEACIARSVCDLNFAKTDTRTT